MRFLRAPRDARQALANCLIRIGESPVWVGDIDDDFNTNLYYPMNGKTSEVNLKKVKDINIQPVPLGYVNFSRSAEYITRRPTRRWKQGLTTDSLNRGVRRSVMKSKALANCILGRYPKLEDALGMLEKETHISVAFDRNWSVEVGVVAPSLFYKGRYVGIIEKGEGKLLPKFEYLIESLAEVV